MVGTGETVADDALRHGLIAGDRTAFEVVYRRHNAAMLRVATAILRNPASAEEVVQDSWLSVLRNAAGFEHRSSLAGWIFAILTNAAKSRARRDGRMVAFDPTEEGGLAEAAFDARGRWRKMPQAWDEQDEITPERVVDGRRMLDHVTAAIDDLPPAQRAVLVLRGQMQLEAAEVCAMLGLSEGNMRVLLHRARLALRTRLDVVL